MDICFKKWIFWKLKIKKWEIKQASYKDGKSNEQYNKMRNQTMLYWDDEITKKTKENPNLCKNHLFEILAKTILSWSKFNLMRFFGKSIWNVTPFKMHDKTLISLKCWSFLLEKYYQNNI
jgi:hypothetical protein